STGNEGSISVTMDGERAYFSSDRDSLEGNYDIYETLLDEKVQPVPVAVLRGHTYDSLTKARLSHAAVVINDARTGEKLYRFVSNRGDGSYMITLPVGKNYTYVANRIGYQEVTGDILLADSTPGVQPIGFSVPLLPQGYTAPIYDSLILTIHFPINSKSLSDSAKNIIQSAIMPWLEEEGFVLLVSGYTDNTGTPMLNEELSAMRAKLVADEIMGYGLSEFSVTSQGWGEAAPVASNDTEIGRDMNRRVEVVIRR
ncbi:MAG TPA: OmpA family protein, partial [Flavipsychrobacter sp.]